MPRSRHPPDTDTSPADLIGTTEASRILDISPATVTRWAAEGTLRPVGRLNNGRGALIFRRGDVDGLAAVIASEHRPA